MRADLNDRHLDADEEFAREVDSLQAGILQAENDRRGSAVLRRSFLLADLDNALQDARDPRPE